MALIVLPLVFLLLWLLVWTHRRRVSSELNRRGAFLLAWVLFELLVLGITELTSIGHHFTSDVVLACWLAIALVLLVLSWGPLRALSKPVPARHKDRGLVLSSAHWLRKEEAAWLLVPAFFFGVLVYLGIVYLPSNADSLDYHLARVMHWIEDRSVGIFPAHFTAQVDYSPLAEYNLAHFHLLVGSDRMDGFVQLSAAVVCVAAASEIARLLGGSRLAQIGAAVICITTPSIVLSATSTENNLFAASLGACLIYAVLALPVRSWSFAVFTGLAASLALMTKGTALVVLGPTAIVIVIFRLFTDEKVPLRRKVRRGAVFAGIVVVVAAAVAGPFLYQEQRVFGSLDGPDAQAVLSADLTWRAAGANIVRSTASNFRIGNGTSGPETAVSRFILSNFHRAFDVFGVRIDNGNYFEGNDTPPYFDAFAIRNFNYWDHDEDEGANPLQVVLICFTGIAAIGLLIARREDRRLRLLVLMVASLTIGYLLLAGMARWQIFEVRFFIPLFVVWSPVVAVVLARCSPWLLRICMVVLMVAALPQLLDNSERPLMRNSYGPHPLAAYFLDSPERSYIVSAAGHTEELARVLAASSCRQLGIGSFVAIEYPVWVGLHDDGWNGEIQDVAVDNVTSRYAAPDYHPCAVLTAPNGVYVANDKDRIQMSFGPQLDLSIRPEAMRFVHTGVDGFSSAVAAVRIFPGSGWSYGTGMTPRAVLKGRGSIYLDASNDASVALRMQSSEGQPVPGVTVSALDGSFPPAVSGPTGIVRVSLRPGMHGVQIEQNVAVPSSGLTAVKVVASPTSAASSTTAPASSTP